MTVNLTFPKTPSLNELMRWKYNKQVRFRYGLHRAELYGVLDAQPESWSPPGLREDSEKVHATIARYSSGTLDDDNFRGGCKPLVDALKKYGYIYDDSPQHFHCEYAQVKCRRGEGKTTVRLMYG